MDTVTVLVDILVGLWCVAVLTGIVRAWEARGPKLAPISPQAQERYWLSWERITRRFVFQPWDAAQEADSLVLSLLKDRGHPVHGDRLPARVRTARGWLSRDADDGTEALRQAMLHYQQEFERMIGRRKQDSSSGRRRELA
jgi:hypothetical protein